MVLMLFSFSDVCGFMILIISLIYTPCFSSSCHSMDHNQVRFLDIFHDHILDKLPCYLIIEVIGKRICMKGMCKER